MVKTNKIEYKYKTEYGEPFLWYRLNMEDPPKIDKCDFEPDESKHCELITSYKDRIEYLENLVRKYKFDYLTGLMGKRDFNDKIDRLFEECKFADEDFYFALIDINDLHNINRLEGYHAGDQVIKDTATTLREHFQFHHIYRISGDEFALLIRSYHISLEEITKTLEKIPNVGFVVENAKVYDNPKQMFKELDIKLINLKKKKGNKRV